MTFHNFLSECQVPFKKICAAHHLSKEDSEDLIQEISLALWKKWDNPSVDKTKNVVGYAMKLIGWRAKDFLRRNKERANLFISAEETEEVQSVVETKPCRRDELEIVNMAISSLKNKLKPRELQIFSDHFVHEKSISHTRDKLKLDNQTIYLLRCRAAQKIIRRAKEIIAEQ